MKLTGLVGFLCLFATGCSSKPANRTEAVEVSGSVKLPGGVSPKDLTITFQPTQNSQPGGSKIDAGGKFVVQLAPGDYIVYFQPEANAAVAAYKSIPSSYRAPNEQNKISVGSGPLSIDVK